MVVEHVFVTTNDSSTTLSKASELLRRFGFAASGQGIPLTPDMPSVLEMKRGRARRSFQLTPSGLNLPQKVSLTWDRGRVTVVATIDNPQLDASLRQRATKPVRLQEKFLLTIASALDGLLSPNGDMERAAQSILKAENEIRAHSRRVKIGCWTVIAIVILISVGMIVVGSLVE